MKTLNKVVNIDNDQGQINEIVLHNDKMFRLVCLLKNNYKTLKCEVRTPNGDFIFVLDNNDIGHDFTTSYVSDEVRKGIDMEKGLKKLKDLIKKLY